MIEGLRLARFYQETQSRRTYRKDCATCREQVDVNTRQNMGCVYEEPTEAPQRAFVLYAPFLPWRDREGKGVAPSACPLYLGRIAEQSDVHDAAQFYRKDSAALRAWLGRRPDRTLLECFAAIEHGENDWAHANRKAGA